MHAFRFATEPGTREGLKGPFFQGYADSLGAMHGWSDGDPFLVNYIGHPMQGAVTSNLLIQHDYKYRAYQFGKDKNYWKSRLRGMAYAWVFSTQFEIGPLSEATLGNIQKKYPAHGFADHVITPTLGTVWVVGEDALDRYVVRWVERRSSATWLRIATRIALNPARGMANIVSFRTPWRRDDRPTIYWDYAAEDQWNRTMAGKVVSDDGPHLDIPVFEFNVQPTVSRYGIGDGVTCVGGGGLLRYNAGENWSLLMDVGGCRLIGLGENRSGDSLSYLFGAGWTGRGSGRWTRYLKLMIGGTKVTEDELLPDKIRVLEDAGIEWRRNEYRSQIANAYDKNAFAFLVGGGLDVNLSPALSLQIANLDYTHTRLGEFRGHPYTHNLRLTTGLTLRVGTW